MKAWQRHLLFWLFIYIAWSYMKTAGTFRGPVLIFNILNIGIYMAAYYFLKHYQLPKLYNQKKWLFFGLSFLMTSLVFYSIWRLAGILWMDDLIYRNSRHRPFWNTALYLTQTVQFYSPTVALLAIDTYNDRQKEKLRIEQLEKEKIANELKFLKAQINPHFLFNTLNNLYSYVVNQSPKAPDIIMQLSGMLDYVLYRSQKDRVALKEELECLENFIALEQIRYGERLEVT
ncbi:MAG: histidine kinase [Bacteroidota bacterium]